MDPALNILIIRLESIPLKVSENIKFESCSAQNFFFSTLNSCRLKLHVNGINAELGFMATESTKSMTPHQLNQLRVYILLK
jgi:hypothetical protein